MKILKRLLRVVCVIMMVPICVIFGLIQVIYILLWIITGWKFPKKLEDIFYKIIDYVFFY